MNLTPQYIIINKIINRITVEKNYIYRFLPLKWLIKKRSKQFVAKTNKESLHQNLQRLLGSFENFPDHLKYGKDGGNIINWADKTLSHEFDYMGSGLTKLEPIDWHIDFKSGFRWPKGKFYKKYVTVDFANNADVKVPWELSRCHHLLWLGEAYLIKKDEKYAKEVVDQIEGWIKENPLMYSINWTCAMDVAIRAVNWMYAVNMILSSSYVTNEFSKKLSQSLFEHGFFIYNNLEKGFPYSANHYASDITGLLFIGQCFMNTKQGSKWWLFALSEYFSEVRQQVLPSGVHFERSIPYHRLMTELFGYPYFMLLRTGVPVPIDIHHRIQSMFEFIANYTKPNGLSPIIGDNDDGRLLPFVKYDFRDHGYLLTVAHIAFKQEKYGRYTQNGLVDSFFLLDYDEGIAEASEENMAKIVSRAYPDAGFAILRDDDFYLFFSNSGLSGHPNPLKKIHGTHTHADALSFELSIDGDDFIIDPGSYVYTASVDYRNKFRTTGKHNTVTIDDLDQLELLKENLFCVKGYHEAKGIRYTKSQEQQKLEGEFTWHLPAGETGIHKRKIEINNKNDFLIQDELIFQQPHIYTWHYHFAPELEVEQIENVIFLIAPDGKKLSIQFACPEQFNIEIIEDTISPCYGVIVPSKTLKIVVMGKETLRLKTKLEHFQ